MNKTLLYKRITNKYDYENHTALLTYLGVSLHLTVTAQNTVLWLY